MWNLYVMLADARDQELRREVRAREPLHNMRWARTRRTMRPSDRRTRPERAQAT
jgi:hypothetical protein